MKNLLWISASAIAYGLVLGMNGQHLHLAAALSLMGTGVLIAVSVIQVMVNQNDQASI